MKSTHTRTTIIPDRIYFRIGEVSNLVGVDPHVLRYWESEFTLIKPRRAKSKQRLYRRKDVENLLLIKTLLHDEGYTIAGARRLLKETVVAGHARHLKKDVHVGKKGHLADIKDELKDILKTLTAIKE